MRPSGLMARGKLRRIATDCDRGQSGGTLQYNTNHKHYIYNLNVKKEIAAPRRGGGEAEILETGRIEHFELQKDY